nr:hypothetical protein CFP56_07960 [Quercus suber]
MLFEGRREFQVSSSIAGSLSLKSGFSRLVALRWSLTVAHNRDRRVDLTSSVQIRADLASSCRALLAESRARQRYSSYASSSSALKDSCRSVRGRALLTEQEFVLRADVVVRKRSSHQKTPARHKCDDVLFSLDLQQASPEQRCDEGSRVIAQFRVGGEKLYCRQASRGIRIVLKRRYRTEGGAMASTSVLATRSISVRVISWSVTRTRTAPFVALWMAGHSRWRSVTTRHSTLDTLLAYPSHIVYEFLIPRMMSIDMCSEYQQTSAKLSRKDGRGCIETPNRFYYYEPTQNTHEQPILENRYNLAPQNPDTNPKTTI